MNEQQKPQSTPQEPLQNQDQLQALKQTIKENKILQNKNSKLEAKYVELFKEQKALKKDHSLFVSFIGKLFNADSNADGSKVFQESAVGQFDIAYLQKIASDKESAYKRRIEELSGLLQQRQKEKSFDLQREIKQTRQELVCEFEQKTKNLKEQTNKQINGYFKELELLKKTHKSQNEQLTELRNTLQLKNSELSKTSKEKLKLEHHLNNIRKKEFSEELSPQKEKDQEKLLNERNEFLSLRQQVESLMAKRDELKRNLKEKQTQLAAERKRNHELEEQIKVIRKKQSELDEKYELIRQCSLEELQNLILTHHYDSGQANANKAVSSVPQIPNKPLEKGQDGDQIQKQYLKNILTRYIKAQTSGAFDQALTLLEVIGTLLKLDPQSSLALESYKSKRKQWWYIKY